MHEGNGQQEKNLFAPLSAAGTSTAARHRQPFFAPLFGGQKPAEQEGLIDMGQTPATMTLANPIIIQYKTKRAVNYVLPHIKKSFSMIAVAILLAAVNYQIQYRLKS